MMEKTLLQEEQTRNLNSRIAKHMAKRRDREGGYTAVEYAMGAVLALLILAGILVLISQFFTQDRVNSAVENLGKTRGTIITAYNNRPGYGDDGTDMSQLIVSRESVPEIIVDDRLQSVFGGAIDITNDSGSERTFRISYQDLDGSNCERMAAVNLGPAVEAVEINGSPTAEVPPNPANVAGSCDETGNEISWIMN